MEKIEQIENSEDIKNIENNNDIEKKKKSKGIIIPLSIFMVIWSIYIIGAILFSVRFMPNTKINGINCSFKTVGQVKQLVETKTNIDTMEIISLDDNGKNVTEQLDLTNINYSVKINEDELKKLKKSQRLYIWFVDVFGKKEYNTETDKTFDEKLLLESINKLEAVNNENYTMSKDAYLDINENGYEIVNEVLGNQVDSEKLETTIIEAIETGEKKVDIDEKSCYILPTVYSDDKNIKKMTDSIDKMLGVVITYDFETRSETLDYPTFYTWIGFDDEQNMTIDDSLASEYITFLAQKYDTLRTVRSFKTSHGTTAQIGGGIYGWQTNVEESKKNLIEILEKQESATIEPVYTSYAQSRSENDIGNTYIEIDLTTQHMWYYVDGVLYTETGIVSGLPEDGRATPTGVFKVWIKEEDRFLTGADYKLHVDMWMQVDWTGVGIHDAYWQPSFGEEYYKIRGRGSHGCLNTPKDICRIIYNRVELNTPVIIYNS